MSVKWPLAWIWAVLILLCKKIYYFRSYIFIEMIKTILLSDTCNWYNQDVCHHVLWYNLPHKWWTILYSPRCEMSATVYYDITYPTNDGPYVVPLDVRKTQRLVHYLSFCVLYHEPFIKVWQINNVKFQKSFFKWLFLWYL